MGPRGYTHLDKSGPTSLTLVGFLPRVDACVGFQVGWSVELCPADVAAIRFLSCRAQRKGEGLATAVLSTQDPRCSPEFSPFRCQTPWHEALALTPVPFGDGCGQAALGRVFTEQGELRRQLFSFGLGAAAFRAREEVRQVCQQGLTASFLLTL